MMRRVVGSLAGPVVASAMTLMARVMNGRKLRPLSKRERKDLEGVVPGLDLTRVRVAEGCQLPLLSEFVAITLGRSIYVRGHLAQHPTTLLAHELAHVWQFRERGWLGMTSTYATMWLEHGYARHPLELEAHAAEFRVR
jgi:Domain of unknown function (DUF4157)